MEYRQLGSAGVRVSVIGWAPAVWGSDRPQAEVNTIVAAALDLGINFIDAANTYTQGRSEETLGEALKGRWEKCVVASKFVLPIGTGPNDRGASRYHIMQALEVSLRRLQSDHIDLYYVHRWDPTTRLEETLRALDDLLRLGKCATLASQTLPPWQLEPMSWPNCAAGRRWW